MTVPDPNQPFACICRDETTMSSTKALLLSVLLALSPAIAEPPKPVETKYLKSLVGMFLAAGGEVRYAMTYEIKDTMPEQFVLRVSFENPKIGEAPITEPSLLEIDGSELTVQSGTLECIRNNQDYEVVVEIYADEAQEELLDTHRQRLEFAVSQDQMTQLNIEVC